jgi:mannosyltransferase
VIALVIGRAGGKHEAFQRGLEEKVAAAGLAERIRFTGEAPASRLPDVMRSLSLVCQMPRYEGYGMVPLEAMASGVPFVATEAGYYRAFSAQGRTGLVVPQVDVAGAVAAMDALLSDPARLEAMSGAAREVAVGQFSAKREADGIGAVYEALWSEG